jgi:hypothetical protein
MSSTRDGKSTKAQFKQWLEGERSRHRRRAIQNPRGHLIFQILYWLLIVAIVFFAYLNINP